jgi:Transposase DDE domain
VSEFATVSKKTKGYDAGKRINGRKTFGIVDTLGLLMAVVVVAASLSDNAGGITVADRARQRSARFAQLWCDSGFKRTFIEHCRNHHVGVEVVNRIHPGRLSMKDSRSSSTSWTGARVPRHRTSASSKSAENRRVTQEAGGVGDLSLKPDPKASETYGQLDLKLKSNPPTNTPSFGSDDRMTQLTKLTEMKQAGLLTDEEFTTPRRSSQASRGHVERVGAASSSCDRPWRRERLPT